MAGRLFKAALALLLLGPAASALRRLGPAPCPPMPEIIAAVAGESGEGKSCNVLRRCVSSASMSRQNEAAAGGAIEAVVAAMRRFPDEPEVQIKCTSAIGNMVLFNRPNGLRAGRLGALNLTLAAYGRWMDNPRVARMGGNIGAYLDYVNENRDLLRELGGVHLLVQNIRNNFKGRLGEWGYEPVKESLFGLSSGCWRNQDLCVQEGLIPLVISLMTQHAGESKIGEESLQVVLALVWKSEDNRKQLVQQGILPAIVKVMKESLHDRGALSLSCKGLVTLVGPDRTGAPGGDGVSEQHLDPKIQAAAGAAGAVQQVVDVLMGGRETQHHEHEAFNFDVDSAYNAHAECLHALSNMAADNGAHQGIMLEAGLAEHLAEALRRSSLNGKATAEACKVLAVLSESAPEASAARSPQPACDRPWGSVPLPLPGLYRSRTAPESNASEGL